MLAIVTARLHAMYHGSRMMLTFLIVIFLAVMISWGVLVAIGLKQIVGGKFFTYCMGGWSSLDKQKRK